ncbi:type III secretion system translocon protein [Shewanella sp. NKUCC05_KAH]|uniref:type III secretion system translocon protein n=1 Tax=Shewanella sp. NKUCC05_KAH TaxID=2842126 RepID=UPI001C5B9329|nr:type III secretion system translocon protein [Shewanella sp. NKUCC05_KAH]MBW3528074.1 type III secretion system translocon protein [Shewanella sp. NKUCC05_KAH]
MSINSVTERGPENVSANYASAQAHAVSKASLPDWSMPVTLTQTEHKDQHQGPVTMKDAQRALQRILTPFFTPDPKTGTVGGLGSLNSLEKASMDSMVMMAANLSISTFADTASSAMKASKIMTDTQEFLRDKKVKEYQEQLTKAIEQADKAHKGGIFGAIFDWIVGAVEAIYGVIKLVEGALRCAVGDVAGGALEIAGGAAYLAAGVAGMVKAAAETAILCGADKDKCQSVIDVAGKVQLGCEIVGMALDIFQAGRAISATRSIAKGTETAMKEAAPKLVDGITKGSTEAVTNVAKEVGKQVAEQVTDQVMANLGKGLKEAAEQGGRKLASGLMDAFSKEAIEQLVTRSVEEVGKQAIKKGVQVTAEEITKQVVKEVSHEVIKTAIKACTFTTLDVIRATAGAGKAITDGSIAVEKAKLQKQIEELILKQNFLEFCYEWYDKAKEQQMKTVKDLIEKQGDSLDGASKAISQSGALQARIAGSTV